MVEGLERETMKVVSWTTITSHILQLNNSVSKKDQIREKCPLRKRKKQ